MNNRFLIRCWLGALVYFLPSTLFAQDIRMVRDTVMVDDEPYAVFQSMGSVTKQMYAIKNLQGELLVLMDQSQLRDAEGNALMRFMFTGYPEKKAFIPVSLQFRRRMMRSLVAYDLVQKNQLNEKGVDLFCRNYPGYFESNRIQVVKENTVDSTPSPKMEATEKTSISVVDNNPTPTLVVTDSKSKDTIELVSTTQVATIEPPSIAQEVPVEEVKINYSLVNRDIDQPIYLDGNVIRQDFEEIGLYTVERIKVDGGSSYYAINMYDIRHDFVAEANIIDNNKTYEFKTYKDSKTRTTNVAEGDIYETVKSLAAVLSQLLYL